MSCEVGVKTGLCGTGDKTGDRDGVETGDRVDAGTGDRCSVGTGSRCADVCEGETDAGSGDDRDSSGDGQRFCIRRDWHGASVGCSHGRSEGWCGGYRVKRHNGLRAGLGEGKGRVREGRSAVRHIKKKWKAIGYDSQH